MQRGLNSASFAEGLGIYEEILRRYEREKAEPDLDGIVQIARALEIPIDHLLSKDLEFAEKKLTSKKPRLLLLDVDGTLTDGGLYYSERGDQMKRFSVKDGMAITRAMKNYNFEVGLISGSSTLGLITARADALGITKVFAGKGSKIQVAESWTKELGCSFEQVAFVGDDLNDLPLLRKVGVSACPADAAKSVKLAVDFVLERKGGEGCVRELLEDKLGFEL